MSAPVQGFQRRDEGTIHAVWRPASKKRQGRATQSRFNFPTTALATLWIVTDVLFSGLGFVGVAPRQQAAHALDRVHGETVTVHPPAPARR
jgi:hypothetical protein